MPKIWKMQLLLKITAYTKWKDYHPWQIFILAMALMTSACPRYLVALLSNLPMLFSWLLLVFLVLTSPVRLFKSAVRYPPFPTFFVYHTSFNQQVDFTLLLTFKILYILILVLFCMLIIFQAKLQIRCLNFCSFLKSTKICKGIPCAKISHQTVLSATFIHLECILEEI